MQRLCFCSLCISERISYKLFHFNRLTLAFSQSISQTFSHCVLVSLQCTVCTLARSCYPERLKSESQSFLYPPFSTLYFVPGFFGSPFLLSLSFSLCFSTPVSSISCCVSNSQFSDLCQNDKLIGTQTLEHESCRRHSMYFILSLILLCFRWITFRNPYHTVLW